MRLQEKYTIDMERKQVPEELLMTDAERLARIRAKMKPVEVDAKNRPNLSLRARARIAYINIKQSINRRIMSMMTRQTEKAIRKQVGDSTWYGKILFAILDVLPLPNLHEIWKAVQKELPDGSIKDKLKLFWQKIDGMRTIIAILVALLGYYHLA